MAVRCELLYVHSAIRRSPGYTRTAGDKRRYSAYPAWTFRSITIGSNSSRRRIYNDCQKKKKISQYYFTNNFHQPIDEFTATNKYIGVVQYKVCEGEERKCSRWHLSTPQNYSFFKIGVRKVSEHLSSKRQTMGWPSARCFTLNFNWVLEHHPVRLYCMYAIGSHLIPGNFRSLTQSGLAAD